MSASSQSIGSSPSGQNHPASSASEGSSGLRSFWKRPNRDSEIPADRLVQQSSPSGKKQGRLSRFLRAGSSSSIASDGDSASKGSTKSAAQARRQQVYQAQKRHRNRKADYVRSLELEVSRLQQMDAVVNNEKQTIAFENTAIRQKLNAQSLDVQLQALDFSTSSSQSDSLSSMGSCALDVRFDAQMGHHRTFVEFLEEELSRLSSPESVPYTSLRDAPKRNNPGDSWAALDFILALEWPCQDHVPHVHINPNVQPPPDPEAVDADGHALTAMSAVYASAHPPFGQTNTQQGHIGSFQAPTSEISTNTQLKWQLPHSEIDKLVAMSEHLQIDDEQITPSQAYSAIKDRLPNNDYLRPTLEALKEPLGSLVNCYGFGAVLSTELFWQFLDGVVQALDFTRPSLASATAQ
ncbi:hypothetical protein K431DRAFT_282624 [Polychaeton citri CBS 116435]|uniref:BZIP domain-containing protein n=1 Tax=Polychaeton citri CBS 116435 TaxID=1314669 RepID=A0A9P4UTB7_9PEZI|nr:hypothetical protein K431DRAFT_282624 [Polychaeton citri CBS 116435]